LLHQFRTGIREKNYALRLQQEHMLKSKWSYGISNPNLVSCKELKDVSNIYAFVFKKEMINQLANEVFLQSIMSYVVHLPKVSIPNL
jgi:hypothetical protein